MGLSPRGWGTYINLIIRVHMPRFIPAGAGNTMLAGNEPVSAAVYPRWRGEHKQFTGATVPFSGLSPLARGTRHGHNDRRDHLRFIPAGAGNTSSQHQTNSGKPVYPRWRGEHICRESLHVFYFGLSPLARGTHPVAVISAVVARFIPAGAGNTW
ncbi:hypothetical protein EBL_c30590 [Shimwellia blattae DSM 4481 = NBRC 105725]|uniref:Uncharacterized protein n=1 Tax=Shimwellia blattae (strain ATCC 29907 / DSM 4481 / JCM 1650 / NBRC 105725 / CDC 9005-74) TaxID=630626 RepID=I2BC75_SHIBC|nr:hypothetical protein EBL_c30590 [Shimwellia blattae DSM 4481 = NBRC 105725]